VLRAADPLIVLSQTQAKHYIRAGVSPDRLEILPNFVPDDLDLGAGPGGDAWLYAGRLSPEKGVVELVHDWPHDIPLVIAGDGPSATEVRDASHGKRVVLCGAVSRRGAVELMKTSRGLVFPSRGPETFGLVYAEAIAAGTPVLASHPSAAAELVCQDRSGMSAQAISADIVRQAHATFPSLRQAARQAFERLYTERAHVDRLEKLYILATQRHSTLVEAPQRS
jgi:glycosyltransferase involved in cell wall biosynthesis